MPQSQHLLDTAVRRLLEQYFATLDGQKPAHLHAIITQEVERTLIDFVMQRTGQNQSMTARWLGINRNTLHKKLEQYRLHPTSTLK
jgi:Fis family transcriptional regulator